MLYSNEQLQPKPRESGIKLPKQLKPMNNPKPQLRLINRSTSIKGFKVSSRIRGATICVSSWDHSALHTLTVRTCEESHSIVITNYPRDHTCISDLSMNSQIYLTFIGDFSLFCIFKQVEKKLTIEKYGKQISHKLK